jgi:hypothetical protein
MNEGLDDDDDDDVREKEENTISKIGFLVYIVYRNIVILTIEGCGRMFESIWGLLFCCGSFPSITWHSVDWILVQLLPPNSKNSNKTIQKTTSNRFFMAPNHRIHNEEINWFELSLM